MSSNSESSIDVTEEFIKLDYIKFRQFVRSLGDVAVGISFTLLDSESDAHNEQLLRLAKAFLESNEGRNADVVVVATGEQVKIDPNAFSSGIIRLEP